MLTRVAGPVAVLSDVHGVLPALEAVLDEPVVRAAELVVVTGDIASGPQPAPVLDLLLGDKRVLLVRGNADRELVELIDGGGARPVDVGATAVAAADPVSLWASEQLRERPDLVDVLRELPHPVTVDVAGFGPVLFCHGTPRADDEVVLVDSRPQRWTDVFAALPEDVQTVVCGHTHMPFLRLADRRLVINPGSVGMPYGGAGAHWAVLDDGAVTLRTTGFDVERARALIASTSAYPDVEAFTDEYLNSRSSDFDALAAFGPRDGRATEPNP